MLQTQKELNAASIEILQKANDHLYNNAVAKPSLYLPAVSAMKKILAAVSNRTLIKVADIALAEKGLQEMLSPSAKLPSASSKTSYESLSTDYFKNLNKSNSQ